MEFYLLAVTLSYLAFMIAYVVKKLNLANDRASFFSVSTAGDRSSSLKTLKRTFEASNATFSTSILGLYGLASYNLFYALYLIIGYLLGVLFFAKYFLPKMEVHLKQDRLVPEVLTHASGSRIAGLTLTCVLGISMLAFFYTEVLSFSLLFLGEGLKSSEVYSGSFPPEIITILLLVMLGAYISLSGYRSLVATDSIQLMLIRLGCFALLVITLVKLSDDPAALLQLIIADFEAFPHWVMFPAIVLGLVLAQVGYYENWLRISLFYARFADEKQGDTGKFFIDASRQFERAVPRLFALYCVPLLLAVAAKTEGTSSLYALLEQVWYGSAWGMIAVALALLAFVSALLSTADTYLLTCVHLLSRHFKKLESLTALRTTAILLSVSAMPFVALNIDIGPWLQFLFYSGNGLIGPVIFATLGWRLNGPIATLLTLSGVLVALLFIQNDFIDIVAAAVVATSLVMTYVTSKKPTASQLEQGLDCEPATNGDVK
ncbi:MAG: hypothetical protein ACPGMR_04150 [Pontibacterium sp.]